ncbi:DUF397 domain-containing protein [Streptomyces sp. NPDC087263]|uniref:DUF397 domain-containing protein n=1 Tax=Streptomyces sp. NPDC087263 TaxID=3365773 RepID=UPI0038171246
MTQWQKSSFSGGADGNECIELAQREGALLLRESEEPTRVLPVSRDSLLALLRQAQTNRA